jgi:hypothetical protein
LRADGSFIVSFGIVAKAALALRVFMGLFYWAPVNPLFDGREKTGESPFPIEKKTLKTAQGVKFGQIKSDRGRSNRGIR